MDERDGRAWVDERRRGPCARVHMHRFLLNAQHVRTLDPDEADFFYVPGWPKCMLDAAPNGAGLTNEAGAAYSHHHVYAPP